ncbi:MAG: hypothetical protein QM741_04035 [Rudaea sp.]|uniref:hypothetical protein n=1 Tax=Rudaea sp. TaxID=2136325 RepID=UPI0039E45BA6
MNITLAIDEKLAERARAAAKRMGKSLNQAVRDHLEQLAGASQREADHAAFEKRALAGKAKLRGWKFDREEANRRA